MTKKKNKKRGKSKSFNINSIFSIIIILLLAALVYGLYTGKLQTVVNNVVNRDIISALKDPTITTGCSLDINPNIINSGDLLSGTLKDGANTYCEIWGYMEGDDVWRKLFEVNLGPDGEVTYSEDFFVIGVFHLRALCDTNGDGKLSILDCVTPEEVVTVLNSTSDCVDSDGGKIYNLPGHVTYASLGYYDDCLSTSTLKEYYCEGDIVKNIDHVCTSGETCVDTRSGGYCTDDSSDGHSVGDEFSGSEGGGTLSGGDGNSDYIYMGDIEVVPGGDCTLGAKIHTTWTMTGTCDIEIGGFEQGLEWIFSDSSGIKWSYADAFPQTHDVDLCPLDYDGVTPWKISMYPMYDLPDCVIDYDWKVTPYICECN